MATRGRKPGFRMTEEHRGKIKTIAILNALGEHALGKRKMLATQVAAGLGLLKKVMPDLAAVEHSGETRVHHDVADTLPTEAEWEAEHSATHH